MTAGERVTWCGVRAAQYNCGEGVWHPGSVLATMEALRALDLDGITVRICPPPPSEGLTVKVGCAAGTAAVCRSASGLLVPAGRFRAAAEVPVPLDYAHDLSWRGPEAWVWPESETWARPGCELMERAVGVYAYGFIQQEASRAFRIAQKAIERVLAAPGEASWGG